MRQQRSTGITLVEILIAMSILAILSLLGYKAFSNLLISRERLLQTSRQWVELARVFRRMENDLARLPTAAGLDEERRGGRSITPFELHQNESEGQLTLTVYSARHPSGSEILRYQWGQAGLSWTVASDAKAAVLGPYTLLPAGYKVQWRFMMQDGQYQVNGTGPMAQEWPQALEMRVVMPDGSAVTRLWSIS